MKPVGSFPDAGQGFRRRPASKDGESGACVGDALHGMRFTFLFGPLMSVISRPN